MKRKEILRLRLRMTDSRVVEILLKEGAKVSREMLDFARRKKLPRNIIYLVGSQLDASQ